ncbi:hypothetical protein EVAR_87041_1 [Eumeta japonica]|uniref:Uncharacterized protein n=1 Tax=Eumeta variegata TaxID=151549 RepID=A0A4C1Z4A2_EUMVA|nr:hypothetical protein EVAR_87041_1 [Eumeta japonica]
MSRTALILSSVVAVEGHPSRRSSGKQCVRWSFGGAELRKLQPHITAAQIITRLQVSQGSISRREVATFVVAFYSVNESSGGLFSSMKPLPLSSGHSPSIVYCIVTEEVDKALVTSQGLRAFMNGDDYLSAIA